MGVFLDLHVSCRNYHILFVCILCSEYLNKQGKNKNIKKKFLKMEHPFTLKENISWTKFIDLKYYTKLWKKIKNEMHALAIQNDSLFSSS